MADKTSTSIPQTPKTGTPQNDTTRPGIGLSELLFFGAMMGDTNLSKPGGVTVEKMREKLLAHYLYKADKAISRAYRTREAQIKIDKNDASLLGEVQKKLVLNGFTTETKVNVLHKDKIADLVLVITWKI